MNVPETAPRPDAGGHCRRVCITLVLVFAALALVVDPIHFGDTRLRPLRGSDDIDRSLGMGTFRRDAVRPDTEAHQRQDGIATLGSWAGSGDFVGTHATAWQPAKPKFTVLIAGYPGRPGNELTLEFRNERGQITQARYAGQDSGPTWEPWYVAAPPDAAAIRIRAVDASTGSEGWFAFSEPFTIRTPVDWQALAWLQLTATTCLALVLLYGPGLVWLNRRRSTATADVAIAIVVGPLLMLALGLLCWAAGGIVAPTILARIGVVFLVGWLAWQARKSRRLFTSLPTGAGATIAASALLVGFCVAKANIAIGPPGELYSGLVSRSLEVGGHSDSRVPFHIVQVVANHLTPFGETASAYFSPWTFASRGPLAGLVASPIVLATGARVPREMPDQPWRPFDREGFAAYRIALIVLASLAAWAVYGTTAAIASPAWGLVAVIAALFAPFFVHEMYFTWPKLIAAAMALVAFTFANSRRPFHAGLALGFGYLFHPLAVLSAPFLALWIAGVERRLAPQAHRSKALIRAALFATGLLALVGLWQIVGLFAPAGGGQTGFIGYFQMADGAPATWHSWWSTRWQNFANTFIPFHLLAFDPNHESLNSIYAPSPSWVRAGFLFWNTLPFGLGVPLFLLTAAGVGFACWRRSSAALLAVVAPSLLLIAYWGAADSGLMRHAGQVLFLSTIVLAIWALSAAPSSWRGPALDAFLHPWCFVWRGAEIGVMAFATTFRNGFPHWASPFGINDAVSLVAAVICFTAAVVVSVRAADSAKNSLA